MTVQRGLWALALVFAMWFSTGCSTFTQMAKGGMAAFNEQPSMEVSLDRLEDLDEGLKQVNALMFETPIDEESAWVEELEGVSQPISNQIVQAQRQAGPYSLPNRSVPTLKVYRVHTQNILTSAKTQKAKYGNFVEALNAVVGDEGKSVTESYKQLSDANLRIGQMDLQVAALEEEEDRDGTTEARKLEIAKEIEGLKVQIDDEDKKLDPLEEQLFSSISNLGSKGVDKVNVPLGQKLFKVLQHSARLELASGETAALVLVQAPRAIPGLPGELQGLAQRWFQETLTDVKGEAAQATQISPDMFKLDFSNGIGLKVEGYEGPEFQPVLDRLLEKVTRFYDLSVGAPGRVASVSRSVNFQAKFLVALTEGLGKLVGTTFVEQAGFTIQ
jgi:hypothetical protein